MLAYQVIPHETINFEIYIFEKNNINFSLLEIG